VLQLASQLEAALLTQQFGLTLLLLVPVVVVLPGGCSLAAAAVLHVSLPSLDCCISPRL
jgi:hypothetical protein